MKDTLYLRDDNGNLASFVIDDDNAEKIYKELKQAANAIKNEFNIIDYDEGEDDGK